MCNLTLLEAWQVYYAMHSFARGDGNTYNKSLHYYDMLTNENLLSTNQITGKKRTFIHYQKENILALVKLDISYLSHGKSKIYF